MCNPKFGTCCYSGRISLPPLQPAPPEFYELLTSQDDDTKVFHDHVRNYNSALAMTFVGRKLDDSLNRRGGGPYSFRLRGELIHRVGSLLPPDDQPPVYTQLYIVDFAEEAHRHHVENVWNSNLHPQTLHTLQDMLFHSHPEVHLYKQAVMAAYILSNYLDLFGFI
jgi:hypothetical protein